MWEKKELGQIINLQRGYDLPHSARSEGKYPVISSSGITDYHAEYKESGPGVITGRYGTIGEVYYVEGDYWPHNTTLFVEDFKGNYPRFIYYLLQTLGLENNNDAGAVPGVNRQSLHAIKTYLPPLPLQRRIATVLGRYDALLENYQQQVAALEGLAQEVYQEWFVRGRCPGAEAGPEGELPAGWRTATLDEVAYDTRRIIKIDDIAPDAAYVGLEHLSVKSISITVTGTPDDIGSDKLAFEENDILFGKIRAYLHKVCLAHFAGICSTDAIVIRPRIENALSFVLFTVFSERFIEYADLISNGTKMPRSEWSVLKTYQTILPDNRALAAFEEVVRPMLDKIANIQKQSKYLRATRAALLPRLLSGQLTVNDAEANLAD
ncbi:hypothetical protein GCM10023172_01650 [Hymenobacter ginsengisoli]|uniref:Type I restriction modification DNA specificity domain-containing protein n=1 Tax=Hymenobacter ginsengisoli TaxID=1051626 RepID=A0ABP8PY15_9BACT|nr:MULTISPECIES: restriction endonuclease subunit S [unclassified Hymenobacter]MBO2033559.1 restriction endonuclease subunit S [Hymenobacter sp. BT559]